jgi:hypothetical protein
MLQTVRAEVDIHGQVHLLEPLHVTQNSPAIVTVLEAENSGETRPGNAVEVLRFLQENRLPAAARPRAEEIEIQIQEAREAWD